MAASDDQETGLVAIVKLQGEAGARNTIGGIHDRNKQELVEIFFEETKEGRVAAVVETESVEEPRVGDEAALALADEGDAGEGGGLRCEAEEDLGEEVDGGELGWRRRLVILPSWELIWWSRTSKVRLRCVCD
jgi:hypothetical protein